VQHYIDGVDAYVPSTGGLMGRPKIRAVLASLVQRSDTTITGKKMDPKGVQAEYESIRYSESVGQAMTLVLCQPLCSVLPQSTHNAMKTRTWGDIPDALDTQVPRAVGCQEACFHCRWSSGHRNASVCARISRG
jgi:hypothetical protein